MYVTLALRKEIFIFYARHMKYIFNVSSWRKHAEMICCLFSLQRDMKVHFFLNEAFFLYFLSVSYLNFSDNFFAFFAETLPLFFAFSEMEKKCKMNFSFHEKHVNVPDNMNIMLWKKILLRFLSSPCNILFFSQQSDEMLKFEILCTKPPKVEA